ncbi:MAG TPA: S41 family peptidase [Blastocatellia bacterium]|jgi:carboxyl-terminal processing protease|nr:S41 family peptidase [Blastocatellia bacterium]
MKRFIALVLLCAASWLPASARDGSGDRRQEAFDIVWRTVKEKHFDPTFGGVDWDKVRERYAPRVTSVASDQELYALLQQMLGELGQSHFNIIPPEAIVENASEPPTGTTGISVKYINNQLVITHVVEGSPAAAAGLRQGFVIKQVGDTPAEQIADRLREIKQSPAIKELMINRLALARIDGKPDSGVRLVYLDERNRTKEVTVTREKRKGEMSQAMGNFPPQYMEFESRRLEGGIGYVRFNIFVMPLLDRIRAAIREMSDAPGIIIDLRGNPGGVGAMSSGIVGVLETRQVSLGTMKMRTGQVNFMVFPQKNAYAGPVAVLIDSGSASTSEIFASGIQEIGRAVIVGERSAGAALPSVFQKLPTGAIFQYAIGDFKSPRGTLIEGHGVIPDVEVKLSRSELLKGSDPQIDAAIKQIKKRANAGERRAG